MRLNVKKTKTMVCKNPNANVVISVNGKNGACPKHEIPVMPTERLESFYLNKISD